MVPAPAFSAALPAALTRTDRADLGRCRRKAIRRLNNAIGEVSHAPRAAIPRLPACHINALSFDIPNGKPNNSRQRRTAVPSDIQDGTSSAYCRKDSRWRDFVLASLAGNFPPCGLAVRNLDASASFWP